MSDINSDKASVAKYVAFFGAFTVFIIFSFFSLWVYSYYTHPRPPEDAALRQYVETKLSDVDRRIRLVEEFNRSLKMTIELKQQIEKAEPR